MASMVRPASAPSTTRSVRSARILSARELNRALLDRQHLLERVDVGVPEVLEHLVGLQAQLPLAPYIALWARVAQFDRMELANLMESRRVVRANALLRTTIHLVTDRDALAMRALLAPVAERAFATSPFARNLGGLDFADVVRAGRALLEERPMSIAQLGTALAEQWPGRDPTSLGYVVRLLVPTVQAPPRGLWGRTGQPMLALTESWLGRPLPADRDPANLVLRYLAAFGPASVSDMRTWSWLTGLREVVERLRPGLRTFRDERGRELLDLPDAPAPVRFFPEYDNVFLSHADRTRIIPPGREWYLGFPPGNGGMRGTYTVDGFLAGTWRIRRANGSATLAIATAGVLVDADLDPIVDEGTALLEFAADDVDERIVEVSPEA
jgi:hypothetical protein